MATLTYDPTPADQPEFTPEEQDSLKVGEAQAEAEQQMLAGKFKDAEELEKAYLELQSKLGERTEEPAEPEVEEPEQQEEDQPEEDDATADMILQMNDEYLEKGELSTESLDKLKEMSSSDLVDAYFKAQSRLEPDEGVDLTEAQVCLLYTSPSPRDVEESRMPSSA